MNFGDSVCPWFTVSPNDTFRPQWRFTRVTDWLEWLNPVPNKPGVFFVDVKRQHWRKNEKSIIIKTTTSMTDPRSPVTRCEWWPPRPCLSLAGFIDWLRHFENYRVSLILWVLLTGSMYCRRTSKNPEPDELIKFKKFKVPLWPDRFCAKLSREAASCDFKAYFSRSVTRVTSLVVPTVCAQKRRYKIFDVFLSP